MVRDDELLAEAKRRYPPGTRYWNLDMAGGRSQPDSDIKDLPVIDKTVEFKFSNTYALDGKPTICVHQKGTTMGWVYSNKIWAEIVKRKNKNFSIW